MNFNDFYSSASYYFSQDYSHGMAECLKKYNVSPCLAVDIGAGEGRNSLYLASQGYSVIAIEPSDVGVSKIVKRSSDLELSIDIKNTDFLSCSPFLEDVGLVIALTSLEHMEPEYMQEAIKEIKRIMKPGGYIYALVFTEEDPGFTKDIQSASECAMFVKHYFRKDELRTLFSDFSVLEYSEYVKEDNTHGPIHYHGKAKLFAQKK